MGIKAIAPDSKEFLSRDITSVPEDELFLYKYFQVQHNFFLQIRLGFYSHFLGGGISLFFFGRIYIRTVSAYRDQHSLQNSLQVALNGGGGGGGPLIFRPFCFQRFLKNNFLGLSPKIKDV
jgi:hypothetical protein